MPNLSVIIPTKDRSTVLIKLVNYLKSFKEISEIIIVDSSHKKNKKLDSLRSKKINYIYSEIKSAAVQRNIGMDSIKEKPTFLAFLDDDTWPDKNYFINLMSLINKKNAVGVSGVTSDVVLKLLGKPQSFVKQKIKLITFLDSNLECTILPSAVNVPIKNLENDYVESEWLIGCAVWKYSKIKDLRFEKDLHSNSVGEDVIFSIKAGKKGPLYVAKSTVLAHNNEDLQSRSLQYFSQWVTNRLKILKLLNLGFKGKACYLIANTASAFIFALKNVKKPVNFFKIIFIYIKSWKVVAY